MNDSNGPKKPTTIPVTSLKPLLDFTGSDSKTGEVLYTGTVSVSEDGTDMRIEARGVETNESKGWNNKGKSFRNNYDKIDWSN